MSELISPNRRILIVDDNEAIHGDFRKILAGADDATDELNAEEAALFGTRAGLPARADRFDLDSAYQGQEALVRVQAALSAGRPYALAFVDVRMPPGWDGVETIPHLWRADPALHIVICSAYSDHTWDELITKLGLSDRLLILKKPFDATEVRQIAVALTEKWNLARQAGMRMEEVESLVDARTADLEHARVELASARDAAEAANRAKSAFLANMSHEIRTPMTAILGYAENLLDWELSNQERESAAHTILRNGEHLLAIINDILDISKIEAGKFTVEHVACRPAAIAVEVMNLLRARAESRGLTLTVETSPGTPEEIVTDPTRLRQILMNLAGNALKFTSSGGVRLIVGADAAAPAPAMTFDVVDTGVGMTVEQAENLFQPFQQADSSTTRAFGGTGLGLYISRRLAQLLGGDLRIIATEPGRGTHVRATIAAEACPHGALVSESPSPALAPTGPEFTGEVQLNCRVLLVEDGPDNQRLIGTILRRAGAVVVVAENGRAGAAQALEAVGAGTPFDVILMDMQMPELDGYQATVLLRDRGYRGPIIALTAHAMRGDEERCRAAGCTDYATKPVDRRDLLARVHRAARAATARASS